MQLPSSSALVPRLIVLESAGSTNDELVAVAADASAPEFTTIVTLDQTGGKGRLGRQWVAPAGRALAVSVLLRPVTAGGREVEAGRLGWLPLIAGVAMASAVGSLVGSARTRVKWPNDVLVDGLKISGLLAERAASGAIVMGAGLNISTRRDELPVPTATSLALSGVARSGVPATDDLIDLVLSRYLAGLIEATRLFSAFAGDADASGIRRRVATACGTLGQEVRVELPGGGTIVGEAVDIDADGRLVVRRAPDGDSQAVAAGDVTHLRYE